MSLQTRTVEVSRSIGAPAARIFAVLATPQRHVDFDGSDMLRGAGSDDSIHGVGDSFTMAMHRMGRDYSMINYIVEFEQDRRIAWEPAPGDLDTAGGDPARIGVASGYRWGYVLVPEGDDVTTVTECFDCGSDEGRWILEKQDGAWINGSTTVVESMTATLALLDQVCTA